MLLWIIYIDNKYNIHRALKAKYKKYPIRMYQVLKDLKYRNAKYIYRWHLMEQQDKVDLILKLERFLTEECLDRQQWWDCLGNICLWYIKDKKQIKYWPSKD